MRITPRDVKLVRDVALSHVLSRDQVMRLGYFSSLTRVNTRLKELCDISLLRRLETPFFSQSLYVAGSKAREVVGARISAILSGRSASPRFLQHALMVTETRLQLLAGTASTWRFEQQVRTGFTFKGLSYEVRPDGLAVLADRLLAVEVDLGHVAPSKFAQKLTAYRTFIESCECLQRWSQPRFDVLVLTTGQLRASHLRRFKPSPCPYDFTCQTFADFGLPLVGGWS